MKKMVSILAVGFLFAALMTAPAVAQEPNLLGLYIDEVASDNHMVVEGYGIITVYLVLSDPVNPDYNGTGEVRNVEMIGAFECGLTLDSDDIIVGIEFPLDSVNIGNWSTGDFIVGFALPGVEVGDDRLATLATISIFSFGEPESNIYLRTVEPPSIPGHMAYVDRDVTVGSDLVAMYPASGYYEIPVFYVNDGVVATENMSWGNVKSLYR